MNPSPDLIRELEASRPTAPPALRARVREIAAQETAHPDRPWLRLPARRIALVALPAAAALALVSAGAIGLSRSNTVAPPGQAERRAELTQDMARESAPGSGASALTGRLADAAGAPDQGQAIGPTAGRVQQVNATLAVQVEGSDDVSSAAQKALDLTRRLGGHVVSATVATGEEGGAELTVRVPVGKVQDAIVGLSALGSIVSQQVRIDDLQEGIDTFEQRQRSLHSQIAVVVARLSSDSLDTETRAKLEARLKNLRADLRGARRSEAVLRAQGRMATIQLSVVTAESRGAAIPSSRLDRTLDEALNVLLWEGVVALAVAIVLAPFALVVIAAWLGQRLYRRREGERLLAAH